MGRSGVKVTHCHGSPFPTRLEEKGAMGANELTCAEERIKAAGRAEKASRRTREG